MGGAYACGIRPAMDAPMPAAYGAPGDVPWNVFTWGCDGGRAYACGIRPAMGTPMPSAYGALGDAQTARLYASKRIEMSAAVTEWVSAPQDAQ